MSQSGNPTIHPRKGIWHLIRCKDMSEHEGNPSREGLTGKESEERKVYDTTKLDKFLSKFIPCRITSDGVLQVVGL